MQNPYCCDTWETNDKVGKAQVETYSRVLDLLGSVVCEYRMPQKAGPLWKPSHVWLLIASSKSPENNLKASIAYSSTQQWILSGGFLGFSIYVKKNLL